MDRSTSLKIAISTLGCKTNQSDAASLSAHLQLRGHKLVSFKDRADVYIIFTCTVTGKTDYQSRQLVRRALFKNPQGQVIVTGCYAQRAPEVWQAIPGVDYVVGVTAQAIIPEIISLGEKNKEPQLLVAPVEEASTFLELSVPLAPKHTRAFLKIQDGCNSFCSYCIVPFARGRNRSLPLNRVLHKVAELSQAGFKEIVLTGIHLGAYGEDLDPPQSLLNLLQALDDLPVAVRFRLSSLEPTEINTPLIEFLGSARKICPHLHIPLQSGDDRLLEKMHRPYTSAFYAQLIRHLHKNIDNLAIGADIICGFPGEDEVAFQNTLQLLNDLPLAYLHVFPYSRRPGTPAADFPAQVSSPLIKERCHILRSLSDKKRHLFYKAHEGQILPVLVEGKKERELWRGYSRNYIPLLFEGEGDLTNQEVLVKVGHVQGTKVFGIICKNKRYVVATNFFNL